MELREYFFTSGEAARILSINRITVWRWIKSGRLNVQRIGREVLVPKWQVELIRDERLQK
jgi:excisionase family DNA binding protein